jgi:hypothetical protein
MKLIAKETYKILQKQSPFYIQNLVNFKEQTYTVYQFCVFNFPFVRDMFQIAKNESAKI